MPKPPPLDSPADERALDRYTMAGLVFMAALIAAFPVYRAGEPARREAAREAMRHENARLGAELYALHCASCHGEEGRGGRGAATLAAKQFLGDASDDQIHWLVAAGIPGTNMPAYDLDHGGPLTAQDVDRVVTYLRSFEETATSVPGWRSGQPVLASDATPRNGGGKPAIGEDLATPRSGAPASAEIESRPERLYVQHCAACHGPEGAGTSIAGAVRPPRRPLDLAALEKVIAEGALDQGMPGYGSEAGGPLDAQEISVLARWLRAAD